MVSALEGVRILDLSGGVAGPLGVLLLAEHGADVIKVERPGGSSQRSQPSSRVWNRSRRSVTVDLDTDEGRELFADLADTADVLVESRRPGAMADIGLGYEQLSARNPRLIYCAVPGYPTGTRMEQMPGYDLLVQARTGQNYENTGHRPGPIFLAQPVASMGAQLMVPIGIMAALVAREDTGRGQYVEVSLVQGVLSLTTQVWNWTDKGQFSLEKVNPPGVHQRTIFECADGEWIHAATMSGIPPTRSEGEILGIEDLDPRQLFSLTPEQREAHEESKRAAYRTKKRAELLEQFHAAGLGAEPVYAPHEKFEHEQLQATGTIAQVDDPEVGMTTQLGVPLFMEKTQGQVKGAQPTAGQHNADIYAELGRSDSDITALAERGVI